MTLRCVVTGAAGFFGSFILRSLVAAGQSVTALVAHDTDLWRIADLKRLIEIRTYDRSSLSRMRHTVVASDPEIVVHAAWAGVTPASRKAERNVVSNISFSVELASAAVECGAKRWIGIGSQAEYARTESRVTENSRTAPDTLYGATKLATSMLVERILAPHYVSFVWLRPFALYGPTDNPEWVIPYTILSLLYGQRPRLSSCEQRLDYLYVVDAAECIAAAVRTPNLRSGAYNLASGRALPLRTMLESARDLIDPILPLGFGELPHAGDRSMNLEGDPSMISKATGWYQRFDVEDGLRETVEWFRSHRDRYPQPR